MTYPDSNLRNLLIDLARTLASHRGWTWREPVAIRAALERGEPVWVIESNVQSRGMNVRVVLRQSDHSLVTAGYLPR
jgi:hypothetical protein